MHHASSADFPRSGAERNTRRSLVLILLGMTALAPSLGCASSSKDGSNDSCEPYSCACGRAVTVSDSAGQAGRCQGTHLCNEVSECPEAKSGTSDPVCESFGDQVINGYSGSCRLPCTTDDECPDGAFCDSFCWFEVED